MRFNSISDPHRSIRQGKCVTGQGCRPTFSSGRSSCFSLITWFCFTTIISLLCLAQSILAIKSANMSYAEIAAKGPKQTPEEVRAAKELFQQFLATGMIAAAPQPPQVELSESTSTSSLVDVDAPSVHTVPSDFLEQEVKTDTQAERREREEEMEKLEREAREAAAKAADKARAEADLAKKKAAHKARKADNWLTQQFASMSDGASSALVVGNFLAVVGLSGYLGYKAWGLYERGRFSWKHAGVGLGVLSVVGAFEGVFTNYLQKGKGKKQ